MASCRILCLTKSADCSELGLNKEHITTFSIWLLGELLIINNPLPPDPVLVRHNPLFNPKLL